MAKLKSTRTKARRAFGDQPPTPAERVQAIKAIRKHCGAHMPRPSNRLTDDIPARIIERCRGVIQWLAAIDTPGVHDADVNQAQAEVLLMVADALEHAEKIVREVGSPSDVEVAHG